MATDLSREQRLRKQAELQSLYTTLANMREREASYMDASANIPDLFSHQIDEIQQQITEIESLLFVQDEDSQEAVARQSYSQALAAEQAGELSKALKLYKKAVRYGHKDGAAAGRSVRYQQKTRKQKRIGQPVWMPAGEDSAKNQRFLLAVAMVLILILIAVFVIGGLTVSDTQTTAAAVEATLTATATAAVVQLIVPDPPSVTPSPTEVTPTATDTPLPPPPPPPTATSQPTVSPTPTPVPTLRPAPQIIGPKDGLVWKDGTIVFEFQPLPLAQDELFCLNTMRGYDITGTENWSYLPVGNNRPFIAIEANVFRVAQTQGMQCVFWSAAIGKGSCENIISKSTPRRVIGLPRPCDF